LTKFADIAENTPQPETCRSSSFPLWDTQYNWRSRTSSSILYIWTEILRGFPYFST